MLVGCKQGVSHRTQRIAGAAMLAAVFLRSAAPASAADCLITFRLPDPIAPDARPLAAIQFDVDYAQADGAFRGEKQTTDCSFALPTSNGAFAAFNNKLDFRVLTGAAILLDQFEAPYGLAHCRFDYVNDPPTNHDFNITVVDASDDFLLPITPAPRIVVSAIQCPFDVATTTTLPPPPCGQPASQSGQPVAADALAILYAAIGLEQCDITCQCDVDGSGVISALDALYVLKASIGLEVNLDCPAC